MSALPVVDDAQKALFQRQVRALVLLGVRVVGLAILATVLKRQMPWLRPYESFFDAMTGILALWPFWTSVGRNWQWRIKLGGAYVDAGRRDDALAMLEALDGIQGRLFDADGKGATLLARARELPQ